MNHQKYNKIIAHYGYVGVGQCCNDIPRQPYQKIWPWLHIYASEDHLWWWAYWAQLESDGELICHDGPSFIPYKAPKIKIQRYCGPGRVIMCQFQFPWPKFHTPNIDCGCNWHFNILSQSLWRNPGMRLTLLGKSIMLIWLWAQHLTQSHAAKVNFW